MSKKKRHASMLIGHAVRDDSDKEKLTATYDFTPAAMIWCKLF